MAKPASLYFKWRCLGLIAGFFFFFFLPSFSGGLPRVNTRVIIIIIIISAINGRSYSGYSLFKNKKYDEFSKIMQGHLIVTEGRGYTPVYIKSLVASIYL